MIQTLRKRHRTSWIILAVLLPILFMMALNVIPRPKLNPGWVEASNKKPAESILAGGEASGISLKVMAAEGSTIRQLECNLSQPLRSTSALLYYLPNGETSIEQGILLGQLGSRGRYRINLDSAISQQTAWHFQLYDDIKQSVIQEFMLETGQ